MYLRPGDHTLCLAQGKRHPTKVIEKKIRSWPEKMVYESALVVYIADLVVIDFISLLGESIFFFNSQN